MSSIQARSNQNPYPTPPSTGSTVQCGHGWEHLGTQYLYYTRNFGNPTYKRVDRFYCNKCCEIKEVIKSECDCHQPEWFDSKNCRTVRD
jgi:hypothetical protein